MRIPELTRGRIRWLASGIALVVVLVALVPVGRWEGTRHAHAELDGIRKVLAAIGPFDQPALDAWRQDVGPGLDCLDYRRGSNPLALEFCFDHQGRVVEGYDRRGRSPEIWSIREEPSASNIRIDRPYLERLIARLQRPA